MYCATYTGMKTRPLAISCLSTHHIFHFVFRSARDDAAAIHFLSSLCCTALSNLAYAVPAGYISISSMTYSETRPNRLGWHGTVASRASERKCITSVRQMARIIFHFNHFTRYKVSHSFSFFGLLLDFLLFAIRKLTEPLEATQSMSSRPHCFLSSDPLSPSLPVSSRTQARSAIKPPPTWLARQER